MTSTWTFRMKAYVIAAAFGLKSTTDRCAAGSVRGNNREYSLRPNILLDPKSFPDKTNCASQHSPGDIFYLEL
ncbi:predicted protein [Histoplasma mississippiense (nom. inval.)]|uniref:predicted protein n=1 Tax=Ajellomyces capsulatus (strain NAm1 / WU24) TaxID=2059318 RepID=UPI000157C907|nr:predicted protein [Histoplasma mississippiense (nom. inval.)]EDN09441.1 predicted protein [Histoplasma mississippiense (nom. inval.)]